MTPAQYNEAVKRVDEKFRVVYLNKMGLTKDDAVYKLVVASKCVYRDLLYYHMLENAYFDSPNAVYVPRGLPES